MLCILLFSLSYTPYYDHCHKASSSPGCRYHFCFKHFHMPELKAFRFNRFSLLYRFRFCAVIVYCDFYKKYRTYALINIVHPLTLYMLEPEHHVNSKCFHEKSSAVVCGVVVIKGKYVNVLWKHCSNETLTLQILLV